MNAKRSLMIIVFILALSLLVSSTAGAKKWDSSPIISGKYQTSIDGLLAKVVATADGIEWQPLVANDGFSLSIAVPDGRVFQQYFSAGKAPVYTYLKEGKQEIPNGVYIYELRQTPVIQSEVREILKKVAEADNRSEIIEQFQREGKLPQHTLVQNGSFYLQDGKIILPGDLTEPEQKEDDSKTSPNSGGPILPEDVVHADDVIVTGSLCVGFDCATDGSESFGFDTIKMKENNDRLLFDDTSTTVGFPANDWRLTANDSASGGLNYFAVEDATIARVPFRIVAGAPTNSLYVDSTGRIGFGTSIPVLKLHEVLGDTPALRLEQDASSGWTPQVWDMAGNESNFFIRDVTGGSKLPFRIQPGAPTNSLTVKSDGKVGMGTWSPVYTLELERTGTDAQIVADRTDGASGGMNASTSSFLIGSITNHPVEFVVNDNTVMTLDSSGNLKLDGYLTELSDQNAKQWFASADNKQILEKVASLPIKTWSYKGDAAGVRHMGPVAQDFYAAFGLGADSLHIAPLDVNGVALASIQALNAKVVEKEAQISQLEKQVKSLESRIAVLEGRGVDRKADTIWSQFSPLAFALLGLVIGAKFINRKKIA